MSEVGVIVCVIITYVTNTNSLTITQAVYCDGWL